MAEAAYDLIDDGGDRARWLEARRGGIGSSDASAILRMSRRGDPLSVYADKVGELQPDHDEPWLRAGRELEPVILKVTAEDTGAAGFERRKALLRSREWPFMIATMDGILIYPSGREWCECKTRADASEWEGRIPDDVMVQVQHQIAVCGVDSIMVGVLFTGFSAAFAHQRIHRDEGFLENVLIPAERELWERVQRRDHEGLDVSGAEYTKKALDLLYPEERLGQVVLPGDEWGLLADELEALRQQRKALVEREDYLKRKLEKEIGEHSEAILGDGRRFTYKTQHIAARQQAAYSFRRVRGPFGKPL